MDRMGKRDRRNWMNPEEEPLSESDTDSDYPSHERSILL
jgi:hypothetical protein